MPRSGQSIKKSVLDKTVAELKKLPTKPKDVFSLRDAVYEIYADIQSVLSKGYSFDEVAALLSKGGIDIKGITLKQYLADYRRKGQKGAGSKAKKSAVVGSTPVAMEEGTEEKLKSGSTQKDSKTNKGVSTGSKSGASSDGFVDMPDDL
jgi:hypothetical protein